jgi:ligand-binding sensor domain-containing protein/two-component sensor histidine kinase
MYSCAKYFFAARAIVVLTLGWSLLSWPHALATTNDWTAGRSFVFRAWGTEAGLPQNTVNALVQTRDGYLWVGTQAGLARFDGVSFKVFGLAEGLPNVQVRSLFEDASGDLWIGTAGGRVSRLHAGRIEGVRGEGNSGDENVTALAADTLGHVWIGTSEGLLFWKGSEVFRDKALGRVGHGLIRALLKDHTGVMWISSVDGLYSYKNGQLTPETGPPPDTNFSPYCLLEDRSGNLWASIGNGKVLCRENGQWKTYDETSGLPFAYVTCLGEDVKGTVWAGSLDAGLYYFQAGKFNKLSSREGLSGNAIRSLLSDREGNLWVGHRTTGLDRLAERKLETWGVEQGLTNDYVRSVAESTDGRMWVGTTGGGLYYEHGGALRLFTNAPFNTFYPFIETLLAVGDGSVWWGGSASLFHWKDGQLTEAFTRASNELVPGSMIPEWLATAAVTALREDVAGGMWVGTSLGKVVHLGQGEPRVLTNRLARGSVTSFAQETDGTLWVGSLAGGLSRMRGGLVTTFSPADGLNCSHVRALYRTSDNVLWIGTGGGGLVRYQAGKFQSISSREGLGDDTVSQILEDEQGCLWLGCNRGVFRIPRSQLDELALGKRTFLHPQAFGLNAGMLAEECTGGSSPAACKLRSGKLAFATVRGVVLIDPRLQILETAAPTVVLEEVRADRKTYEVQPVTGQEKAQAQFAVTIPPGRRECEFHYTGLSFRAPERVRFRYQMSGTGEDWVEADTRRVAYYNPLRPGQYVFHVTACNDEGVWSDHEATLAVTVLPHLWETPWFRVVVGLAILGCLAGMAFWVARRRYKRRLAALETQQAIERERLRISQDMHDQIGGILTRVSILSDVGQSEHEGPALRGQFERIGTQVRSAVRGLDEIVWATNPRNDNLPRFAEYVSRFADEFFEDSNVRCWQEMPTDLPKLTLRADVRHNVFLAVKEALNNVLKHSNATEVWLRLSMVDSIVCLELDDNGRGFAPANVAPGGNGLVNMKSRLAESGGSAEFASAPGQGVKIRFVFPLPKNN